MEKHRRTHKWAFPLGVLLSALAMVGVVTLVMWLVDGIKLRIDNPREKQEYQAFLAKIIVHDPDPFDDVRTVPAARIPQLLDISIWSILRGDGVTPTSFPRDDDTGELLIAQALVEAEYQKIFGETPQLHESIEGSDYDFPYDAEAKVYRVPVTGSMAIYLPRITEINKIGGRIELTVDYLAYNDFTLNANGTYREPDQPAKVMVITLYTQADPDAPYRVGAIRHPLSQDYVGGGARLG